MQNVGRTGRAESGLYDFTAYAKRTEPTGSQKLQIDLVDIE